MHFKSKSLLASLILVAAFLTCSCENILDDAPFEGTWTEVGNPSYYRYVLHQDGNNITGTIEYVPDADIASLSGTASGNSATVTWRWADTGRTIVASLAVNGNSLTSTVGSETLAFTKN